MEQMTKIIPKQKKIALVAHDHLKTRLLDWCIKYQSVLAQHHLFATGTTGHLIHKKTGLKIQSMLSGPMGGDQQIGAQIAEGKIDILIFFWDPLNAVPHDPDVKALLRLATVWNIPVATNETTANVLMSSHIMDEELPITIPDYATYLKSRIE